MPRAATRCRPFTLLDGMILIAATAGGLAAARHAGDWRQYGYAPLGLISMAAVPILVTETVGFLLIRLRPPRPRWRRLIVQPGTFGCVASLVFLIFQALFNAHLWSTAVRVHGTEFWVSGLILVPAPVGIAVATCWVLLALSRRCRRERGWIEILGIFLGCCWILGALLTPIAWLVALILDS